MTSGKSIRYCEGESSEKENCENESVDLCQKMKQRAYYSMFYGPLDIRAAGNQFILINPAKYVQRKSMFG